MPTPSAPEAQPSAAAGDNAAPVARAVAQDLEAIFPAAPAGRSGRGPRLRLRPLAREGARARASDHRAAGLGALIAAGCVGISAGALMVRPGAPAVTRPPPESPGVPIAFAPPGPGPLVPPLTAPAALAPALPRGGAGEAGAADPGAAAPATQLRPASTMQARRAHARRVTLVRANGCTHAGRCGSTSLVAADARLRRAYAAAERAGVAHAVLADYRRQWTALRRRAPREPRRVAANYRELAGELHSLAARQRVADAEPSRIGPWRRLRMQLASLWR